MDNQKAINYIKRKHAPPILEGELFFKNNIEISNAELNIEIVDVTHIDAEAITHAQITELISITSSQTRIPYEIYGPDPDLSRRYIVMATISIEKGGSSKSQIFRTIQSIPVFSEVFPEELNITLTHIE